MDQKFVSKPNVISMSDVLHPYLSKKIFYQDSQNLQQLKSCQLVNLFYFKKKFVYLFIR